MSYLVFMLFPFCGIQIEDDEGRLDERVREGPAFNSSFVSSPPQVLILFVVVLYLLLSLVGGRAVLVVVVPLVDEDAVFLADFDGCLGRCCIVSSAK